ncbi:NAD(P)H-binding protein [Maribellus comscasis]|uniref:NAD(P)H-binding protein n=1 Tax=Maribellus comscasis TaxID=2681766 RepID=A0A6I6JJN4_9BACT|nr:SDR family oxidoreductase [Maribellus comscasis]QGY43075.1 NAD(P)H-binding protein [Maribellus comscasis]
MSKILITGATGNLGKQTLQSLVSKTDVSNLAALVRDESKATDLKELGIEIRVGNYDDIASLTSAFHGIDKLFFVSASDIEKRLPQHKNVLEAAKENSVEHIVYTSFVRKNETDSSPIAAVAKAHIYSEEFLLESGIDYTILRNTLYMEFAPYFMGDKVLENRMVYLPSGDGKVAFLLRSEMAEIAANILTSEGHENKTYTLSSEEAFSYADIAKIISKISEKDIKFVSPPVDEFVQTMHKAGVPEEMIGMSVGFARAIQQGEFEATNPEISKLLGRKVVTIEEFLKQVYA